MNGSVGPTKPNDMATKTGSKKTTTTTTDDYRAIVLDDYRLAVRSREASLMGRKEVLTGKAKFGIFGDGKEVVQIAMAKAFQHGDFRSGYYRDQTWMMALGLVDLEQFFAQLYAFSDPDAEPHSAGRQMNNHFATRFVEDDGSWVDFTKRHNVAADISSTAAQMPRAVGLGLASKLYRNNPELKDHTTFSSNGNEVCFVSIGDASTSEGHFFEAINAAGVLEIPMAVTVYDDGYGISVPKKYQTTKQSISEVLSGFQRDENGGVVILTGKAWDYPGLIQLFDEGIRRAREEHVPVLFHITEVTQPQGHSTSGSHERYKSPERLDWEKEADCIARMREWMIANDIATTEELDAIDADSKKAVSQAKRAAWSAFNAPIQAKSRELLTHIESVAPAVAATDDLNDLAGRVKDAYNPVLANILEFGKEALRRTLGEATPARVKLKNWVTHLEDEIHDRYRTHYTSETPLGWSHLDDEPARYSDDSAVKSGYEILNANFDRLIDAHPEIVAFGEDVGKIGDVNQGFAGLQEKHGEHRVFDTGIREITIMGQAIGLAMRGLRPIAEIQYLDYLIYGLQPLMDDVASLTYRSYGMQRAPVIIRTRGHRLEGIWHTGSPIAMLLNALRGMLILVPRNMTQAAGFYNALLETDEPALLIECLNGYRLKETEPDNMADFKLAFGRPEVLRSGSDVTLVTYGSCVRVAEAGIDELETVGISVELIDVQSLQPFDVEGMIVRSLEKTNRVVFLDEDVPGGATAFMLKKVLEDQDGYRFLDSKPVTLTAQPHRSAYGDDGNYASKPSADDVFDVVYDLMHEARPDDCPAR